MFNYKSGLAPGNQLKCLSALLFILIVTGLKLNGQSARAPHFVGINPGVTIEPFYEKGELDVNIFPLVYQHAITRRFDLRLSSILNLGIRNKGNDISHFGMEVAVPVFFKQKTVITDCSKGFYIAPVISLTRNRSERHNNAGIWLEPGFNLLFDNKVAMSFGLQLGTTYFNYDSGNKKWGNHFGVKIIIGRWL